MQMEAVLPVSADVNFACNHFPNYRIGDNNQILEEVKDDTKGPSPKEVLAQETIHLFEQHKRLSVRDLASKFDKNLTAAAKLSGEAKLKEVACLEGHVLLKKLRDALESLRGLLVGQNKEDVDNAISMVEALAVKLTQGEGELIQQKFEVKKLANFLKQASEDAKKLVRQENSFACAEIESARAVVQRFGEVLEEQEKNSQTSGKKGLVEKPRPSVAKEQPCQLHLPSGIFMEDLEEMVREVQEARRIKMLHHPRKIMDMEHELCALKIQIREKSVFSVKLQRELTMNQRVEESKSLLYQLDGSETLGSCLRVQPCSNMGPNPSKCSIQWYCVSSEGSQRELISGASMPTYAPEPLDVGRILQADITSDGQRVTTMMTAGPIGPAAGLGTYVESLLQKPNTEFSVVISQMNGQDYPSRTVHIFHVGKMRMKLCRGWITKAREPYSSSMHVMLAEA